MQETLSFLREARKFLEPYWETWHEAGRLLEAKLAAVSGREPTFVPRPLTPSAGMGMVSAVFLSGAAKSVLGQRWVVVGGIDDPESGRTGGVLDVESHWRDHYWCLHKGTLFDISADQFGYPGIVISSDSDKRYKRNLKLPEIKVCTREASRKTARIVDLFAKGVEKRMP